MQDIFNKVFILFDNEYNAQRQAESLQAELSFRGVNAEIVKWESDKNDPAELTYEEADMLMNKLGFRR